VLGIAGGIGFAYFVFEYEQLTTLYLGGRINPYVHKRDPAEAALARLGVPFQVRRTSGPAAAERHLRAALDQGEFLEEAAGPLGRPELTRLAGHYRDLATAWTGLAQAAWPPARTARWPGRRHCSTAAAS
jgi:hypothetical protein